VRSTTKQSRICAFYLIISFSVIPAQAGIQKKHQKHFQFLFVSLSLKGLATIFIKQARKRQRTCHAVVSSLRDTLVFLFCSGVATTTSNKSSRFILAKSKIHRRHKCVGLRTNYYCIATPISSARNDGMNGIVLLFHFLHYLFFFLDSHLRGNDGAVGMRFLLKLFVRSQE
jgi:hypothetical protein